MHQSVLGDDDEKDYRVAAPVSAEMHALWGEAIDNAASECGFVINRYKTVRRTSYGEYLKVLYCYGFIIPQLGRLMPFSSERTNTMLDPVEGIRGLASFFRTIVARGGNHEWCNLFLHHVWNIRRGVRKAFYKKGKGAEARVRGQDTVDYPMAVLWTPQSLGGAGELPFTLMAASKDALIYIWAKRFGYMDILNDAAHALDFGGTDVNREIAKRIEASGAAEAYQKWLKTHVLSQTKQLRMKTERDRFPFIKLGDMEYQYSSRRRILQTLRGSSKVNALSIERKARLTQRMDDRKKEVRTKDYMRTMFSWLDHIDITDGEELTPIYDIPIVVGRDPSVSRFELLLGFSTVSNDQRSRVSKLFKTLNDNRFNAEAEFGFDTLVALFTRPDIYPNIERIASVAVRIGSDPTKAIRFAERFVGSFDSALMIDKGQKFSSGDEFSSTLDLSYRTILRVVDIPAWILDTDVNYLVRQLGIMMILTTPMNLPVTAKVIKTYGDSEGDILAALSPKFYSPTKQYASGFPVNSWY
jgi:hypothetical protein